MPPKRIVLVLFVFISLMIAASLPMVAAQTQEPDPDSDRDGIPDSMDSCPDLPGLIDNQGCPIDSDDDGLYDFEDSCPMEYAETEDGCPPRSIMDSDGDTVPDSDDVCPTDPGFPEWNGCPDTDGDGLTTQYDNCPLVAGPRENMGCPIEGTQEPTPEATDEPIPPFVMPSTGACVVAPNGDFNVNVRAEPTTTADISGQLRPRNLYTVSARTVQPDGVWYQVNLGWVASYVVQTGGAQGACDNVPTVQIIATQEPAPPTTEPPPAPPPQEDVVTLVPPDINLAPPLANCPELVPQAQSLPVFIQLDVAAGGYADPCGAVQSILTEVVLGAEIPDLPQPVVDTLSAQCPTLLPSVSAILDAYYGVNPNAWQALTNLTNPQNACQLANQLANRNIPSEFAALLGASAGTPKPILADYVPSRVAVPAAEPLITFALSMCPTTVGLPPTVKADITANLLSLGIDSAELLPPAEVCEAVEFYTALYDLPPAAEALFDTLQTDCGFTTKDAYGLAGFAVVASADFNSLLALGTDDLCGAPPAPLDAFSRIQGLTQSATANPAVPPVLANTCPNLMLQLSTFNGTLHFYHLYSLLQQPAEAACSTAQTLIDNSGQFPLALIAPIPPCFDVPTNTVTLADGAIINQATPWQAKVQVLQRPANQVCEAITLPPLDSDGDTVPDASDACPTEFGTGADGCLSAAVNQAPLVNPVLPQNMPVPGALVVSIAASDPDGTALSYDVVSLDTNIVEATMVGATNTVQLNSVAGGVATVVVGVSDGTARVEMPFNVNVAPAAIANTPPTLNPLEDVALAVGGLLELAITATDAEGDTLIFQVSASDPNVLSATINAANNIVVQGLSDGVSQVLVIAADGSTTVATSFAVTVGNPNGAPPQAPTPDPNAVPLPPGATSTQNGVSSSLTPGIQNNPNLPEPFKERLIAAPATSLIANAVFQAQSGGSSAIYYLQGQDVKPLFDGVNTNNYFPTLSPQGDTVIFIAEDAAGTLSLWLHLLERNQAVPLVIVGDGLQVARYPLAWSPDGSRVLATLTDRTGSPGIYQLDMSSSPTIPAPQLVAVNATTASYSPNGRYIAYEQIELTGQRRIYVMATADPTIIKAVTSQPETVNCSTPMFATNSITLFFSCNVSGQRILYRYGVDGLSQIEYGISNVDNPAPGPGEDFLGFDDSTIIYYATDDGSRSAPMIQLPNFQLSHIRWVTPSSIEVEGKP